MEENHIQKDTSNSNINAGGNQEPVDINNSVSKSSIAKTSVMTSEEEVGGGNDDSPKTREHTRRKMAMLFVLGFFSIQFLCIAYAVMYHATISELKDILVAVIGALSGTLGFIVGYYYKMPQE